MAQHVHPFFRALEEALESDGLIQKLDSAGVTNQKNLETAGKVVKVVPVAHSHIIRGTKYTAS